MEPNTDAWGTVPRSGATTLGSLEGKTEDFLVSLAFSVPGINLSFTVSHMFYRGENWDPKRSSGKSGEDQNEPQRATPPPLHSLQIVRKQ